MPQIITENQKGSIKLAIFITFFLVIFSAIGVFAYSYIFQYEVVNFENVPGISSKARQQKGILYDVEEDVICYPNRPNRPYVFMVTPIIVKLFGAESVTIEGTSADFNRLINEMIFVTEKNRSKLSYVAECGMGGVDAIINMVIGFIEIFKHPIKAIIAVGKLGKEFAVIPKELFSGNLNFQDIKDSVNNFAENYWFDYKCRQTQKYGFDYRKIVFPITKTTVDGHCVARISGEGTIEVATVFVGFLKISKIGKTGWLSKLRGLKLGSIFKYTKKAKVIKPEVTVGKTGKYKNLYYIKKAQKGIKSVSTPQWFDKSFEKIKSVFNRKRKTKGKTVAKRTRTTKRENEIYAKANVGETTNVIVKGQKVKVRQKQDIDGNKKVTIREKGTDGKKRRIEKTNCDLLKKGYAPYSNNGSKIQLHHHKQENVLTEGVGHYVELSQKEHMENYNDLHFREPKSPAEKFTHQKFTNKYWKVRYSQICM